MVVLGGVLASQVQVFLGVVMALAVAGAIIGDSVGYWVGHRYGKSLQTTRLGQIVGDGRWASTEGFLLRRGGPSVFLGRWTALLRALVPSAAGMARLPYRHFVIWNVIGGTIWAVAFVMLGYLAGNAYKRVEHYAGRFSLVILGVVIAALVITHFVRKSRTKKSEQTA